MALRMRTKPKATGHFCIHTGIEVKPGNVCPVHQTTDCMVRAWRDEIGKPPSFWRRLFG